MKRFAVICKYELILFLRDFFGVFFTLVFPTLMIMIFGGIYGNDPVYPGADAGMMDVSVPAYAVMVIGVTGLMSFPLTLSACKEKKIYKRYDATPVGERMIMQAQIMVNFIMTLLGIAILLIAGRLLYGVKIAGGAGMVFFSLLLSVAMLFSMGFLFTAVTDDAKVTNALCYVFYFVMLFLSGATIPDMLFSGAVKTVSKCLPMTYAVDLLQGAFAGDGFSAHGVEVTVLALLTVLFAGIGAVCYRKKDWA